MHLDTPEDMSTQLDMTFLTWFRAHTESSWSAMPERSPQQLLAQFAISGSGGCVWQSGTRWLGDLRAEDIVQLERSRTVAFPPEFRLFLLHLHAPDKPMLCAGYVGQQERIDDQSGVLASTYVERYQQYMVLEEGESFHNWHSERHNSIAQKAQVAALTKGITFDVEHNGLWPAAWGAKPPTQRAREERVRALVEAAPKLLPLFGSRYLLAEPTTAGYPVLSIDQADVVVYGVNLRAYLLLEFADMLGLSRLTIEQSARKALTMRQDVYAAIPFWGSLYTS